MIFQDDFTSRSDRAIEVLSKFNIDMLNDDGSYRPFNDVMCDLAYTLSVLRDTESKGQFELQRQYILETIVGVCYKNQFMC